MKVPRFLVFSFLLLMILFGLTVSANAVLVDNGDGTITDTNTNLMWIQDADYWVTSGDYDNSIFGDWSDALEWADQLTYAGYDDWRLPSAYNHDGTGPCRGYNCIDSELGNLFYTALGNPSNSGPGEFTNSGPFINVETWSGYWSSTITTETGCGFCPWIFSYDLGQLPTFDGTSGENAWVVRDVTVVPEPISSTLFIVGGATLGFRRFRKKNKK